MAHQEIIQKLQGAQDEMRDTLSKLKNIHRKMESNDAISSSTSGQLRSYIIAHFEVLIDDNHSWLDNSTNLGDIIDQVDSDRECECECECCECNLPENECECAD
jgi:hypothetical protein